MNNVKSVADCPKCSGHGMVIRSRKEIIQLECTVCENKWQTLSMICRGCGMPNGYATEGLYKTCYTERPQLIGKD